MQQKITLRLNFHKYAFCESSLQFFPPFAHHCLPFFLFSFGNLFLAPLLSFDVKFSATFLATTGQLWKLRHSRCHKSFISNPPKLSYLARSPDCMLCFRHLPIIRYANVSSTYPCQSVHPSVILSNFLSISVSGCST